MKMLENSQVKVLHNEKITITKAGDKIQLIGIDDPDIWIQEHAAKGTFADNAAVIGSCDEDQTKNAYITGVTAELDTMQLPEGYRILLSHRPERFKAYVKESMNLVLAGHAHGGQIRIPFIGGVVAPDQGFLPKYDAGIYQKENTFMVVSRGIGNSIIPIRINNPPEVVIVKLHSEK